ncbi:myelin protein P0-like [Oryzias latipes]|uniref:myelin protein P0-like n=1 Tax=Oryzias latipes TaxID=8090 RepID=UPI000CE277FD|nr:myelin protein P0-like [Oryzias latipes]XP_023821689.1 myelin protein P0-like [Oryzias latipes]
MWFLGSVLFFVLFGSAGSMTPDIQDIIKKPGDDVTLMCRDPEFKKDTAILEWRREDSEILFLFRDGRLSPYDADKSYRNRVFLNDSQMKDEDLSVVLKNVTMNDTGTYKCRVLQHSGPHREMKTISTVRLSVDPPGDPSPGDEGGLSPGVLIRIVLAVLLVVVPAVVLWISKKKKGPNQSSSGSNNQQEFELDRLNSDS